MNAALSAEEREAMLNLTKRTPCGRFLIRIESRIQPGELLTKAAAAQSLVALSELLIEAATLATGLAESLRDEYLVDESNARN